MIDVAAWKSGPPYQLPLSSDAFARALRRGHGRAVLHVRAHGAAGVEDLILRDGLQNPVYDTDVEDSRAAWVVDLADLGGLTEALTLQTIEVLFNRPATMDERDCWHVVEIAGILARRGDSRCVVALHAAINDGPTMWGVEALCALADIATDQGAELQARQFGAWLRQSPDMELPLSKLAGYGRTPEAAEAVTRFRRLAEVDADIQRFLHELDAINAADNETRPRRHEPRWPAGLNADELINHLREWDQFRGGLRSLYRWFKNADDATLRRIASQLGAINHPRALATALCGFEARAVPETLEHLLPYTDHPDGVTRAAAYRALAMHSDIRVRELAFQRLYEGKHAGAELDLFIRNYREGDRDTIKSNLNWPLDEVALHYCLSDLFDVSQVAAPSDAQEIALLTYELTPCSCCRRRPVNYLQQANLSPDWLLEECHFDGSPDIRKLVAAGLSN